jgi:hypothetical protein
MEPCAEEKEKQLEQKKEAENTPSCSNKGEVNDPVHLEEEASKVI